MPQSCCALGCTYRYNNENKIPFYSIPSSQSPSEIRRRELWIEAINREDWKTWSYEKISKAKICGQHFISGKRSEEPSHPDYVPSVFTFTGKKRTKKDQNLERIEGNKRCKKSMDQANLSEPGCSHWSDDNQEVCENVIADEKFVIKEEYPTDEEVFCENSSAGVDDAASKYSCEQCNSLIIINEKLVQELNSRMAEIHEKEFPTNEEAVCESSSAKVDDASKNSCEKCYSVISMNKKLVEELNSRMQEIYDLREKLSSISQKNATFTFKYFQNNFKFVSFFTGAENLQTLQCIIDLVKNDLKIVIPKLTIEDHVVMTLIKIRQGLSNRYIAVNCNVDESLISKTYRHVLPVLAQHLSALIVWPDRSFIKENLPKCFLKKYSSCVCIVDCFEIFIEKPSDLTARDQTWSSNKQHNTIKFFVAIAPTGGVCFLSDGWGGRMSDKHLILKSGFIGSLEQGDLVLADRDFEIQSELSDIGAEIKVPSVANGKKQLLSFGIDDSKKLLNVGSHVEKTISCLKKFRILQHTIPILQADLLNCVMKVISGIINLNSSITMK